MSVRLTYFFFIPEKGIWKIGRTGDLHNRQKQLWFLGKEGHTVAAFPEETFSEPYCHRLFFDHRLNGEWFKDCQQIRDFLSENKEKGVEVPVPFTPRPRGEKKPPSESRHGKRAKGKTQSSITLQEDLLAFARQAATEDGRSLSSWLERLIRRKLS